MSKDLSGALENYTRLFVNAPGEINFTWRYFLTNKILFSLAIAGIGAIIGFLPLEKIKQKFSVPAMTLLYLEADCNKVTPKLCLPNVLL